jgi:hypothetical protein
VTSDQHYAQVTGGLQHENVLLEFQYYRLEEDGIVLFRNIFFVPNTLKLRNTMLKEMHNVPYASNPSYHKINATVRSQYLYPGMNKYVANYIARCMECQKVKTEQRHLEILLQPFPILEWKWEVVMINFITKLPRIERKHDSIMVVVEKLTKVAHFIPVKMTHKETNIENIYKEIAS